jgi:roadblock/LC7 domain-containing protein
MLCNTLAGAFTHITKTQWVPQTVWSYSGGNTGVFVETAKADFNQLFKALA